MAGARWLHSPSLATEDVHPQFPIAGRQTKRSPARSTSLFSMATASLCRWNGSGNCTGIATSCHPPSAQACREGDRRGRWSKFPAKDPCFSQAIFTARKPARNQPLTFVSLVIHSKGSLRCSVKLHGVGPACAEGRSEWRTALFLLGMDPAMANRKTTMNKLKKLFSPSTLAATVATGMLVSSAVPVLASYQVSAVRTFGCAGTTCSEPRCEQDYGGARYYWCCGASEYCAGMTWVNPDDLCYGTALCGP